MTKIEVPETTREGLHPTLAARFDRRDLITLEGIRRPIDGHLSAFRSYFREAMQSDIGLLDRVVAYLLRQKGKRIRPTLVLLSAQMVGEITETTYRGAALVELLHTATLVHDDVVDDADQRRGLFSINALFKNKVAVLLGDFLLSRGLLLALRYKDYVLLHTVSDAVERMSEGELLQIQKTRSLDIDEETYFRIISDKTASLISACMTTGAQSVLGEETEQTGKVKAIGEAIGRAFQIRDDLFDFGVEDVGKPLGIDLQEKKMTLPLIYALRQASPSERKAILRIVKQKRKGPKALRTVTEFVYDKGGIHYAREKMLEEANEAARLLDSFATSEARDALLDLVAYTVLRSK